MILGRVAFVCFLILAIFSCGFRLPAQDVTETLGEITLAPKQHIEKQSWDSYCRWIERIAKHIEQGRLPLAEKEIHFCAPKFRNFEWYFLKAALSCSEQRTVPLSESHAVHILTEIPPAFSKWQEAVINPDGHLFACIGENSQVELRSTQDGELIQRMLFEGPTGHGPKRFSVCFSSDGRYVASAGNDQVNIWRIEDGKKVSTYDSGQSWSHRVCFSPDDSLLAVAHARGATVWDLDTGARMFSVECQPWVGDARFSPDGDLLALTMHRHPAKIIRVDGWIESAQIPEAGYYTIAWSPASDWVLFGGRSGLAWNIDKKEPLFELQFGKKVTKTVSLSPDGQRLAVPSGKEIQIWDVAHQQLLISLREPQAEVISAYFGPLGRRIISSSIDGKIRVWGLLHLE